MLSVKSEKNFSEEKYIKEYNKDKENNFLDNTETNKILYSKLETIKKLMEFPKNLKKKEDNKTICEYFLNFKFFKNLFENYGKKVFFNTLEFCNFLDLNENEVLMNINDTVKSCYVLLFGTLKIFSKNPIINVNDENFNEINKYNNNIADVNLNKFYSNNKNKLLENNENTWTLNQGEIFADKFLIEKKTR